MSSSKLPVLDTARNAFDFAIDNLKAVYWIAIPYLIISLVGNVLLYGFFPDEMYVAINAPEKLTDIAGINFYIVLALYGIFSLLYTIKIWMSFMRLYLCEEEDVLSMSRFKFDNHDWLAVGKYFLLLLLVILLAMVMSVLVMLFLVGMIKLSLLSKSVFQLFPIVGAVVGVICAVWMIMITLLYFPALAQGGYLSFRQSSRRMRGHVWRTFCVFALIMLGMSIVTKLAGFVLGVVLPDMNAALAVTEFVTGGVIGVFTVAVLAGVDSQVYQHVIKHYKVPPPITGG